MNVTRFSEFAIQEIRRKMMNVVKIQSAKIQRMNCINSSDVIKTYLFRVKLTRTLLI